MGFYDEDVDTVNYVNWLTMGRAGIVGLEQYSPDTKEWTQAHARARFVLLQVSNITYKRIRILGKLSCKVVMSCQVSILSICKYSFVRR